MKRKIISLIIAAAFTVCSSITSSAQTVPQNSAAAEVPCESRETMDIAESGSVIDICESGSSYYGDLNGDNRVTSVDSLLILRQSVSLEHFSSAKKKLADVNSDGHITSSDSLEVLRYSVGLLSNTYVGRIYGMANAHKSKFKQELEKNKTAIMTYQNKLAYQTDNKSVMFANVIGDGYPEMIYAYSEDGIHSKLKIVTYVNGTVKTAYECDWYQGTPQGGMRSHALYTRTGSTSLYMYRYVTYLNNPSESNLYELKPNSDGTLKETIVTRHLISYNNATDVETHEYYVKGQKSTKQEMRNTIDLYTTNVNQILLLNRGYLCDFAGMLNSGPKYMTHTYSEAVNSLG